jgi:hypothetical protein
MEHNHHCENLKSYIYKVKLILCILSLAAAILNSFMYVLNKINFLQEEKIPENVSNVSEVYYMPYISVHLLHKPWYNIHCVDNFTEVKPCVSKFKFPIST